MYPSYECVLYRCQSSSFITQYFVMLLAIFLTWLLKDTKSPPKNPPVKSFFLLIKPVKPNNPAVPPDNAAIDILQYSTTAALFITAASLQDISFIENITSTLSSTSKNTDLLH
ncbi:hypothetical protein V1478_012962 [Vespula squamosa]|uniref:Uncharacterized protein n=1 Tax=Vespula squamosa TaxID=30214 RepID=A0ABD2AAB3_VESSQ